MKIKVNINVPSGFFCTGCGHVDKDDNVEFCNLFDRYIYSYKGRLLKCEDCVLAVHSEMYREAK